MKLLHIADLHFGKRINNISMIHEQRHFVEQVLLFAQQDHVRAVLIAGDVFDRPNPSREALELCEMLLSGLCAADIEVFIVPGNHDSAQQLSFCSGLLAPSGLHISKAYDGHIQRHTISDGTTSVCIHMLPFIRPIDVRVHHPDLSSSIRSYEDAVCVALDQDVLETGVLNVLVAHQFVTDGSNEPLTCDSEITNVGLVDSVSADAFKQYDYVALGHLHSAQHIGSTSIRYAGSPLKYSLSEIHQSKSMTILSIEGDTFEISHEPIDPIHEMREITASYEELKGGIDQGDPEDYMHVTLTDRSLYDAMAKIRAIYPNIMRLDWAHSDNAYTKTLERLTELETASTLQLFEDYFEKQTGSSMNSEERQFVETSIEEASA